MGKLIFTPIQQLVFDLFSKNNSLSKKFYFTGGTALSIFYLQHRYSDDLDFFTQTDLDENEIIEFMNQVALKLKINFKYTKREVVLVFEFIKDKNVELKVDFGRYPYPKIEKETIYQNVKIDSLRDIATNKLLTINQRTSVKDFVDLYYLLKEKYNVWDLIYGLEHKFKMETDIMLLGLDFLKVEDFKFMPKMIKKLTLVELQQFFRELALEVGKRVTT